MNETSDRLWREFGEYVLLAFPPVDNVIERGEGAWLIDVDGNRLLDLASGQLCATVGMHHAELSRRIAEQAAKIVHTGTQFYSPVVFDAAAKLARVVPKPLKRSLFLSTGSEANECAFRMAKTITGRTGIIGLSRGYYGMTLATRSITSIFVGSGRVDAMPTVPDSGVLLTPHCQRCPVHDAYPSCNVRCLETSVELLGHRVENIAAIVIEPLISAGGMILPPPGYLARVRQLADRIGALLILDEAQTAFGRTGTWFAMEHHGVVPDILLISKSAGGGFPAAGVVVAEHLADVLERRRFTHLSSHQADPLAAAAISAVLDIVTEEELVDRAADTGRYFLDRLLELKARWPIIRDVRGQGLMLGVELGATAAASLPQYATLAMIQLCRTRSVHLTTTYFEPTLRLMPPLTISREEIDFAVAALDASFADLMDGKLAARDLVPRSEAGRRYVRRLLGRRDPIDVAEKVWRTSPREWVARLRGPA